MICEIWHKGQFIGQVVGADGPGVRILAKHPITQTRVDEQTLELQIEPKQLHKSV
jgi:hypothetical protein